MQKLIIEKNQVL